MHASVYTSNNKQHILCCLLFLFLSTFSCSSFPHLSIFCANSSYPCLYISAFFISKPFSQAPRLHLPCFYFFFKLLSPSIFFFLPQPALCLSCSSSFSLHLPIPLHLTMFTIISPSLPPSVNPVSLSPHDVSALTGRH